jgi:transcriptional regulator with XRE-family HTH domain
MSASAKATGSSSLGLDLRAARRTHGFSQQKVAEKAGCSIAYVRALEAGYRPSSETPVTQRIADVLGLGDDDRGVTERDASAFAATEGESPEDTTRTESRVEH